MSSFVPSRADTLEDQRLYLESRLVEVACHDCAARVRVKKNSDHHTSIQWCPGAVDACAEFARMAAGRGGRAVHEPCSRLAASIDAAVRDGALSIGAIDGY
jgi:hypothetical protein